MSSFSIGPTSASTYPLIQEEPTSYIELFLLHNPECREQIGTDELLKKTLEEACLEPKKCKERGYQALCAYFDKPAPSTERIVFDNGMTLVHFAALGGQEGCLAGEDLGDVNGSFVAHYLAMGGRETLLDRIEQVKLFALDETGLSPLDYAFMYKRKEVVEWFVSRGSSQLACLMRDVLLSPYAAEECLYTEVGVRILKLLDHISCDEKSWEETKNDINKVLSVFSYTYCALRKSLYTYCALRKSLGDILSEKEKALLEKITLRSDRDVKSFIDAISKKMNETLVPLQSADFMLEKADFTKRASFVLDRMLEVRRFSKSEYESVKNKMERHTKLGEGSYSAVYLIRNRQGKSYALKECTRFMGLGDERERKWYNYLRVADSKNAERFICKTDFVFTCMKPSFVMELCDADLAEFIQKHKNDSDYLNHIDKIAMQILDALAYLRKQGIVHVDLKPRNILVRRPYPLQVLVGDFGFAYKEGFFPQDYPSGFTLQTQEYRSPECFLQAKEHYGCEMDMWSFGCILFKLFTAKVLFTCEGTSSSQEYEKSVPQHQERIGPYPDELLEAASEERRGWYASLPPQTDKSNLKKIIGAAVRRIGCVEGEESFSQLLDLLERVMQLNPRDRILPQEALEHPFFSSLKEKG